MRLGVITCFTKLHHYSTDDQYFLGTIIKALPIFKIIQRMRKQIIFIQ